MQFSRIIAAVHLAFGILGLIGGILSASIGSIVVSAFVILLAGLLFYGASKENTWCILAWLVFEAIDLLFQAYSLIAALFSLAIGDLIFNAVFLGGFQYIGLG